MRHVIQVLFTTLYAGRQVNGAIIRHRMESTAWAPEFDATVNGAGQAHRILAAANEDLFVLRFEPNASPPVLYEEIRLDGVIRGGAAPWISSHPENRSELETGKIVCRLLMNRSLHHRERQPR